MRVRKRAERGFALLIVLWTLVLVSLLILQLTETGSAEARLASNLRRAAVAEQAADGAFAEAAFHLMDRSAAGWSLSGGSHRLALSNGEADVTVHNEAGKVDLNNASPAVLASLIEIAGGGVGDAAALAQAIAAWHTPVPPDQRAQVTAPYRGTKPYAPPGSPFESVDELALVIGVTPALFDRLAPHLTVYQGGDPVLPLADPVVRRAAAAAGEVDTGAAATDQGSNDVVDLRVVAHAGGAVFVREGTVQLEPGEAGAAFRILAWTHPSL